MRFFVPRLLLRNTALGYAYCPAGNTATLLRYCPLAGAIRSAVRLFAGGKYASQIYTFRSYSKKHQYIAISNRNVRLFRFILTK